MMRTVSRNLPFLLVSALVVVVVVAPVSSSQGTDNTNSNSSSGGGGVASMPRYACETAIEESLLFGGNYRRSIVPLVSGEFLDVGIQMEVTQMHISNHGVNGGDVDVFGSLLLSWKDERLMFDPLQLLEQCASSSIQLRAEDIWVPELIAEDVFAAAVDWPRVVTVNISDGSVLWSKLGTLRLHCRVRGAGRFADPSKICSVDFLEESDRVRYVSMGILVHDGVSIPEYTVNDERVSSTRTTQDGTVHLELDLNPLRNDCNLCGHSNNTALIHNGLVNYFPEDWLELFPHTDEWNCTRLDSLLQALNVSDESCLMGRAYFEEACCDDTRSSFECERNIHEQLDHKNTITPPDPSPEEKDTNVISEDMVDVEIQLDLIHVLGVNVQSNTLSVLASLELAWYDQQLAWHPFIGGCHRVSYRASLSAEETEIWVPEIELVNLVQGVHELPDAHASVRYDGYVRWRRTGVLTATCDLQGIEHFPFDETSCSLQFGGTRDPLYHRVNFVAPQGVQFGENLVDESWNYQEYKVLSSKTEISTRSDRLSGFENKIIEFHFVFKRARNYYVNMFVLLYIIFTYLAFGMLFVDYQIGERLGYGSSILFVIVAQDITLADSTPVTQEYLWIYQLSFGSKMFVVYAIVHSIIMLYLYANFVFDHNGNMVEDGATEEEQPLVEVENNNEATDDMEAAEDGLVGGGGTPGPAPRDTPSSEIPISTNESTPGKKNQEKSLRISFALKKFYSYLCCLGVRDSKTKNRLAFLRIVDFRMAVFCILAYTLFIIIMFTAGLA